jgi:hypothetical protein
MLILAVNYVDNIIELELLQLKETITSVTS